MRHLVIGRGEIGSVLLKLFPPASVVAHDPALGIHYVGTSGVHMMHVCIRYSPDFVATVRKYQEAFSPELTVIHSTVPVGTSEELGACHSPVRGPATPELLAFVKFFGGYGAAAAAREFERVGFRTAVVVDARVTEALKLWDSVQYGISIAVEKEIHRWCTEQGLDFELVYKASNETYNEGYRMLGRTNVLKPVLEHVPGPIGGHCVTQNAELLDSWLVELVRQASLWND